MTDADKKMKKYTRAVQRRLNLPKELKARVMSDFISSIQARREAGQTDEAIYAEMGTAKKVAAELNEQMKEFAYRKSPWRFACMVLAALSALWLVAYRILLRFGLLLNTFAMTFFPNESASIGVIGGADGPTANFVAGVSGFNWDSVIAASLLVIGILGYVRLCKCKTK